VLLTLSIMFLSVSACIVFIFTFLIYNTWILINNFIINKLIIILTPSDVRDNNESIDLKQSFSPKIGSYRSFIR